MPASTATLLRSFPAAAQRAFATPLLQLFPAATRPASVVPPLQSFPAATQQSFWCCTPVAIFFHPTPLPPPRLRHLPMVVLLLVKSCHCNEIFCYCRIAADCCNFLPLMHPCSAIFFCLLLLLPNISQGEYSFASVTLTIFLFFQTLSHFLWSVGCCLHSQHAEKHSSCFSGIEEPPGVQRAILTPCPPAVSAPAAQRCHAFAPIVASCQALPVASQKTHPVVSEVEFNSASCHFGIFSYLEKFPKSHFWYRLWSALATR